MLRYRERQYVVDNEVRQDPGVLELASRAADSFILWMPETDELVAQYVGSERFEGLGESEKRLAARAIALCCDGSEWAFGTRRDESGFFPVDVPVGRIEAAAQDAEVLSGATGSFVEDSYRTSTGESIWGDTGMVGELADLQLLGALMYESDLPSGAGARFDVARETGARAEIYVGADLHGDFAMWQNLRGDGSGIAPGGVMMPFSPVEQIALRAYHSVEIDIVGSLMSYVSRGKSDQQVVDIVDRVVSQIRDPLQTSATPFGDYDSSSRTLEVAARKWLHARTNVDHGADEVLGSFLVEPGNFSLSLDLVSLDDGVAFRQVQRQTDYVEFESREIVIPSMHIVDMIAAMASANQGRVSPKEIINLLTKIRGYVSGQDRTEAHEV